MLSFVKYTIAASYSLKIKTAVMPPRHQIRTSSTTYKEVNSILSLVDKNVSYCNDLERQLVHASNTPEIPFLIMAKTFDNALTLLIQNKKLEDEVLQRWEKIKPNVDEQLKSKVEEHIKLIDTTHTQVLFKMTILSLYVKENDSRQRLINEMRCLQKSIASQQEIAFNEEEMEFTARNAHQQYYQIIDTSRLKAADVYERIIADATVNAAAILNQEEVKKFMFDAAKVARETYDKIIHTAIEKATKVRDEIIDQKRKELNAIHVLQTMGAGKHDGETSSVDKIPADVYAAPECEQRCRKTPIIKKMPQNTVIDTVEMI
ncbi:MAG: hypothetical protein KDH96_06845 [Candidatus Riesia sp.]|nr:hypothetical protein [Candidatus Riesia sp.]